MYLGVKNVVPLDDFKLQLLFENNEKRVFDMKPYLNKGIFSELNKKDVFNTVHIAFDTIAWSNNADIDPETLYNGSIPL